MLKMYATVEENGETRRLVIFGLSHGNIGRLLNGDPIKFRGETCGLPPDVDVMIFVGENEREMAKEFAQFVGPETKVNVDPKLDT